MAKNIALFCFKVPALWALPPLKENENYDFKKYPGMKNLVNK